MPLEAMMEDKTNPYTDLQSELSSLEEQVQEQQRLMTKALKMLIGTLDTEFSDGVKVAANSLKTTDTAELHKTVGSLEDTYRAYSSERERLAVDLKSSLESWIRQIKSQPSAVDRSVLEAVENELDSSCESFSSLASLVSALLDLQRRLLLSEGDGESQPTTADTAVDTAEIADSVLPMEALVTIKRLLSLLPLNEQGQKQALVISDALKGEIHSKELVVHLHEIVSILEQRSNQKVDEVAEFLKSLVKQLADLEEELKASRLESAHFDSKEAEHTEQMSQGFKDIQAGLNNVSSFDELKSVVMVQLDHLVDSFNDFKESRTQRIKSMQDRYERVVQSLVSVEGDASAAQTAINIERQRSLTDHLTSLPNRRAYDERLKSELHRWNRYGTPFSAIVIDIDHFKKINDSLGHLIGDRALKLVAKVLQKQLRDSDLIARYGGEEFVILLANSKLDEAAQTADKLRRAIERAQFKYSGRTVSIRISAGVTQVCDKDTVETLFERADKALFTAKKSGRNRVEVG